MAFVKDVTEQSFAAEVLERSKQVPVVVDFWAAWCAPCRALGPTLEREVGALGGRVELAKVDVDQAQALAGQFGVQGIPAVMAFLDGQVVADFVGARDAGFVKKWLAELSPSQAQQALAAAHDEVSLRTLLESPEVGAQAALKLATLLLAGGRAREAVTVLESLKAGSREWEQGEALKRQAALVLDVEAFGGDEKARAALAANEGDHEARWVLACAAMAAGRDVDALSGFLELVTRSRKFRDDGARKAMLTIFERLGAQHELTREYRRKLQTVL